MVVLLVSYSLGLLLRQLANIDEMAKHSCCRRHGGTGIWSATTTWPKVAFSDWLEQVLRCANKLGRPVRDWQQLLPAADFPRTTLNRR